MLTIMMVFIMNGDENVTGNNDIYIFNLYIHGGNNSSQVGAGWLGKQYFGNGSLRNYIVNCSSSGNILANAGGILGAYAGKNGTIKLIGCSSIGSIYLWGGGIVGRHAGLGGGTVICEKCWSSGNISAYGGGIFGSNAGKNSSNITNRAQALNCFSIGNIADGGGGIFGEKAGELGGISEAFNSYSRGTIDQYAGGIFGQNAGENNGNTTVQNCYSSGVAFDINNNGFYGQNKGVGSVTNNSYAANGNWSDTNANSNLTGFPVNPNKIGTTWSTTGSNLPYILTNSGTTPYSANNISLLGNEPSIINEYSLMLIPGNSSQSALIQPNFFNILQFSEGIPSSYNTITINNSSGVILTSKNIGLSIYILYIQVGLYNITEVLLNISDNLFITSNAIGSFNIIAKNTDNIMIAAGNSNNGLFYSNDKGSNWIVSNKNTGNFWSVDINGVNAVAGSKNINNVNEGIFYSTDSGKTWQQTNKNNKGFRWIMISPNGTKAIAASDDNEGLWYSTNTGNGFNNWSVSDKGNGSFRSVYISSDNINAIVAGNTGAQGIWYSRDCGQTWARDVNTISSWRSVIISPDGNYAVAGSASGRGIWYSKLNQNGFDTWTHSTITNGNWRSFSLSTDGNKAIAASNSNMGIYTSILTPNIGFNNWIPTNKDNGNFSIVSIRPDGNAAFAGSNSKEGIWQCNENLNIWAASNIRTNDYFFGIYTMNSTRAIVSSDTGNGIVYSSKFDGFTLSPLSIDEGVNYNGTLNTNSLIEPTYSILYQPFNNLYITGNIVKSLIPFHYNLTQRFPIIIQGLYEDNVIIREFTIQIIDVPQPPVNITLTNNKIAENASIGTLIGILKTTDPDITDTFRYQFVNGEGSDDNNKFIIDKDKMINNTTFNYNTKNIYTTRVKSTDNFGYSVEIILLIFVIIPIANGANLSALLNVNKQIVLQGTPASDESLIFELISDLKYGTITKVSNGIYYYLPLVNKVDNFEYLVKQGSMTSFPGTVVIHNFSQNYIDNIPKRQGNFTFDSITFDGDIWTFGTMRTINFFQFINYNQLGNWRFYNTPV